MKTKTKTITIDYDLYQHELKSAEEKGLTKSQTDFKVQIINHLHILRTGVMVGMRHGIPPHAMNSAQESARIWLAKNFTNEELEILLNNR